MEGGVWSPRRRRRREPLEEELNREGHWTRSFSSRSEPWPIIEHWASEHDYHLVAMRGQRRLYLKGQDSKTFRTFVDVKKDGDGSRVTVSSWVHVGFLARLASVFRLPDEMDLDPTGFWGVRARRAACHELNVLLERFRQHPIIGSNGFHLADIDITVAALFFAQLIPAAAFLVPPLLKVEIQKGLSNPLLQMIGRQAGLVGAYAATLLLVQWVVALQVKRPLYKGCTAGAAYLVYTLMCVFLFTRTASESLQTRFAYHCLHHYEQKSCTTLLNGISFRDRQLLVERVHALEKELSYGPAKLR